MHTIRLLFLVRQTACLETKFQFQTFICPTDRQIQTNTHYWTCDMTRTNRTRGSKLNRTKRGRPYRYQSYCVPGSLCLCPVVSHSHYVSVLLCTSSIVSRSYCVPVPLCPRSNIYQSYWVPVPLCPRSYIYQSYSVPVPLCPSSNVYQSHCIQVPLCPIPVVS